MEKMFYRLMDKEQKQLHKQNKYRFQKEDQNAVPLFSVAKEINNQARNLQI